MTYAPLKADDTARVRGVVQEVQLRTVVVIVPTVVVGLSRTTNGEPWLQRYNEAQYGA